MGDPTVAVNLLWCVPGDVGGSEEYLVRQLLGLADAAPDMRPTLYVVDGFIEADIDQEPVAAVKDQIDTAAENFPRLEVHFDYIRKNRLAG